MIGFLLISAKVVVLNLPVSKFSIKLICVLKFDSEWKSDFQYVASCVGSKAQPIRLIKSHVDLGETERKHFYKDLNNFVFQEFILNPEIVPTPVSEYDWRRDLHGWLIPRIREEHDPEEGARIIVNALRERLGIDSSYYHRVGVCTIMRQGFTDYYGFCIAYVACLRSVGIAARISDDQVQIWKTGEWKSAPALWDKS